MTRAVATPFGVPAAFAPALAAVAPVEMTDALAGVGGAGTVLAVPAVVVEDYGKYHWASITSRARLAHKE